MLFTCYLSTLKTYSAMKVSRLLLLFSFFILTGSLRAQPQPEPGYRGPHSHDPLQDKILPLLTYLEHQKPVKRWLQSDSMVMRYATALQQAIARNTQPANAAAFAAPYGFRENDITRIAQSLQTLLLQHPGKITPVLEHMRRSGNFQRYSRLDDKALLDTAWKDAARAINYILTAYTSGTGLRYPKIDAAPQDLTTPAYLQQLKNAAGNQELSEKDIFFSPSLQLAITLLRLNKKVDAVRYDPLKEANKPAYTQIRSTKWEQFSYSVILILGSGPGNEEVISQEGRDRCMAGAELYRKGLAPFIVVSGGHVHPMGTPHCEAVEMKRYLVEKLHIPAGAVIIEPYARHTTTNIRNTVRILFQSGVPLDKRMLCSSNPLHLLYVSGPTFEKRCTEELGYLPFRGLLRIDKNSLSFYPDLRSLHRNALDPLDP